VRSQKWQRPESLEVGIRTMHRASDLERGMLMPVPLQVTTGLRYARTGRAGKASAELVARIRRDGRDAVVQMATIRIFQRVAILESLAE